MPLIESRFGKAIAELLLSTLMPTDHIVALLIACPRGQRHQADGTTRARGMGRFGPMVTLSRVSDKLPNLGALRVSSESNAWQDTIAKFIASAGRVMLVGSSN
jgi:hypothetical protein